MYANYRRRIEKKKFEAANNMLQRLSIVLSAPSANSNVQQVERSSEHRHGDAAPKDLDQNNDRFDSFVADIDKVSMLLFLVILILIAITLINDKNYVQLIVFFVVNCIFHSICIYEL